MVALPAVAAAALAVVAAVLWGSLRDLEAGRRSADEALAAARAVAPDLLSFDHRTVEQDFARAQSHTTGPLTGHYRKLAAATVPEARRERVSVQTVVAGGAVSRAEPGRVEILLFVNQMTLTGDDGRRLVQARARLVMVERDGRWRVADMNPLLGSPPR
ncbi:hypothetical protein D5H75_20735 [Bailinhaonella thermotolerans]|uniref:Mce-associated membrane protein n=1 Tax=Bailinhaonella thermotolerans TaxID=1070861 RepID=A0A3A4B9Y3_9ACTN|nr:hypothetical protein D5H75_20735 [Bailinhaonella thermotolerans]